MTEIIRKLKLRPDLNSSCIDFIDQCFGHIPSKMLKRKLTQNSKEQYSNDLRSFAQTLHFYSPEAYEFVRRSFSLSLPHQSTLRCWYSAVEGKPGFTSEAFEVTYIISELAFTILMKLKLLKSLVTHRHSCCPYDFRIPL